MPKMKVYENIFISNKIVKHNLLRTLDRKEMIRRSEQLLAELGATFSATQTVRDLGVAQRQMVEIAKALALDARLIIFDEPSAALTEVEIRQLMAVIRKLKAQGRGSSTSLTGWKKSLRSETGSPSCGTAETST